MATNIHAVTLVANRPGDAAYIVACLDQNGLDARLPLEFECRGKSCRTRADDDCCALHKDRTPFPMDERRIGTWIFKFLIGIQYSSQHALDY
jgi:hypothetical protein